MKAISKKARSTAEALIKLLIRDAKMRAKGKPIPTNDPDYAEAYGVLRGVLAATYGNVAMDQPIRLGEGPGPKTHDGARAWLREISETVSI